MKLGSDIFYRQDWKTLKKNDVKNKSQIVKKKGLKLTKVEIVLIIIKR